MSKQSEAKERQGYEAKPLAKVCANCARFNSDKMEVKPQWGPAYTKENNLRCGLGGFAVKKTATCREWSDKEDHPC